MKKWLVYTIVLVLVIVNVAVILICNQKICNLDKKVVVLNEQIKNPNLSQITIPGGSLLFQTTSGAKVAEIINTPNGGGLKIYNDKEKIIFDMYPWTNGGAFVINNNQGKMVSVLSSSDLGSIFFLNDFLGKPKAGIETTLEKGVIVFYGKDGKIKEVLGK